jgi:hypothetical protein
MGLRRTTVATKLHHQSSVRCERLSDISLLDRFAKIFTGSSNSSGRKVDDRKPLQTRSFLKKMEGGLNLLRVRIQLLFGHDTGLPNLTHHSTLVPDSLDDVTGAGLTFCTNKCSAFRYATESLAEISCPTDKGYFESVFIDVVFFVCRSEHFGFIDVVDANCLQDLYAEGDA